MLSSSDISGDSPVPILSGEHLENDTNLSVENMADQTGLSHLGLGLEENEELDALTLTTLLNSGVEEALSNLSPAQLIQLEKNVQKLKKQKSTSGTPGRRHSDAPKRKRSLNGDDGDEYSSHRTSGGQFMNLPASAPQVELRDGVEYLLFTYSTKGHIQEYCISIDVDNLSLDDIPDDFKSENCVYPRALVPREAYTGNRYEYETIVNELAWKLTWLNPTILSGKRGLIQRAVDSYRNRTTESRSRRVLRQEKLSHGTLRRRPTDHNDPYHDARGPKSLTFQYNSKGEPVKVKVRVDVENVDISQIDDEFKRANCLYPEAFDDTSSYHDSRWEYEYSCNELGWKLAYLNSSKLSGNRSLLAKAIEAYHQKYSGAEFDTGIHTVMSGDDGLEIDIHDSGLDKNNEFSEMVAHTLHQALSGSGLDHGEQHHYGLDDEDEMPQTVSTAELLGN